nr:preprotein translocase subunit SecE [Acidomonas methanolica]
MSPSTGSQKPPRTAGKTGTPRPAPGARFSLLRYLREVRAEAGKVAWPSRRNTMVMTGAVLVMAALTSVFFFIVDQVIGLGVRELFGVGG